MKKEVVIVLLLITAGLFFVLGRLSTGVSLVTVKMEGSAAEKKEGALQQPAQPSQVAPQKMQLEQLKIQPKPVEPVRFVNPVTGEIAKDASPYLGAVKAKVTLLVVSDFQCPVCKRAAEPLKEIAANFDKDLKIVFKHNPLEMHKNALNAAAAAFAASRQGKFWEYHDILFNNQAALTESDLFAYAQNLDLDMEKFKKDYYDQSVRNRARKEGELASQLGAHGTPAFFVNGKMQVGWASTAWLKQMISMELSKVNDELAAGLSLEDALKKRISQNSQQPDLYYKLLNIDLKER